MKIDDGKSMSFPFSVCMRNRVYYDIAKHSLENLWIWRDIEKEDIIIVRA